jgi:hypothetical protein
MPRRTQAEQPQEILTIDTQRTLFVTQIWSLDTTDLSFPRAALRRSLESIDLICRSGRALRLLRTRQRWYTPGFFHTALRAIALAYQYLEHILLGTVILGRYQDVRQLHHIESSFIRDKRQHVATLI